MDWLIRGSPWRPGYAGVRRGHRRERTRGSRSYLRWTWVSWNQARGQTEPGKRGHDFRGDRPSHGPRHANGRRTDDRAIGVPRTGTWPPSSRIRQGRAPRCLRCRDGKDLSMPKIIRSKDFRVRSGEKVRLEDWPTTVKPVYKSKKQYQEILHEHTEALSSLQRLHYASNRYALLLVFQGMDSAGKDGVIRHVMSGINPQGCEVFSFKQPSAEELQHDFLWRTTRRLPERGRIGIFNRSYYEEVLIVRVHPEILRAQSLPDESLDRKTIWNERYRSIAERS